MVSCEAAVLHGCFVPPFSFANLLMLYFATGSKTSVSLLSSGLHCGSYSIYSIAGVETRIYTVEIKFTVIY